VGQLEPDSGLRLQEGRPTGIGDIGDYSGPYRPSFLSSGDLKIEEAWAQLLSPSGGEAKATWRVIRIYSPPEKSVEDWSRGVAEAATQEAGKGAK
jgi:hypothetical protein